jgi:hypothetical protein
VTWLDDFVSVAHDALDERTSEALWSRGASDEQIEMLQIGYVNGKLPEGVPFPDSFLKWCFGGEKLVDSFVFPLTNTMGDIRGVQFRSVERDQRGYKDYFLNRAEPIFFGLSQAMSAVWDNEAVLLVEGTFDYMPVQRVVPYTIPILNAKVPDLLLRTLRRIVRRVYLFYDADPAGRRGQSKFSLGDEVRDQEVRQIEYPTPPVIRDGKPVKDPGELWESWGDDRLSAFLRSSMST